MNTPIDHLKNEYNMNDNGGYDTYYKHKSQYHQSQFSQSSSINSSYKSQPKKWERINRADIDEKDKVMTPNFEDFIENLKNIKDREELVSICKSISIQKGFRTFYPHAETCSKTGEAKSVIRCSMCTKAKVSANQ